MSRRLILLAFVVLGCTAISSAQPGNCVSGGTYLNGSGHIMYCTGIGVAAQIPWSTDIDPWTPVVSQQTTNNSDVVVKSIPLAINKAALVTVSCVAARADYSTGIGGTVQAMFLRDTGNVSRSGAQAKTLSGGMSATCDLTANPSTQAIDVSVRGEGSQTDWFQVRVLVAMGH